jgi:hypothetical protein
MLRAMRPAVVAVMAVVAFAALATVAACGPDRRKCTTGAQCQLANGGRGLCLDFSCAYDDPSCASGLRFDEHAEEPNHCVPRADASVSGDAPPLPDGVPDAPADDATTVDATKVDGAADAGDAG